MITLHHIPKYAPCGFIVSRNGDAYDEANSVLVQTDWDFPGLAQSFGATLARLVPNGCDHDGTDGTVTCPACKATASDFISAAWDYLAANAGATTTDPGYFP